MAMLDHWHPVLPSQKLQSQPLAVVICGRQVCLFRTQAGQAAAVDDVCPHRRLKLSAGQVVGDRIRCQYHGWTFAPDGQGESPGSPKLHACTESFHVREDYGYVWIRSKSTAVATFPELNPRKYYPIGTLQHVIPAPLEVTLDNFTEIEHSGTVHNHFGYDLDRMNEVQVAFASTEREITVTNVGPTKRIFKPYQWLLGINNQYRFHDNWIIRFSPVYAEYDHYWTSPDGSREGMVRWHLYQFFWPVDDRNTTIVILIYAKSRYPGIAGGLMIAKGLLKREFDREVKRDVNTLHHLADYRTGLEGMKLGRFDKVLGLTRERIARIYRGRLELPVHQEMNRETTSSGTAIQ
jgi:phenylpropionate dioxygenase-like ring-hydroxylating dioxygenase large terminal subunit